MAKILRNSRADFSMTLDMTKTGGVYNKEHNLSKPRNLFFLQLLHFEGYFGSPVSPVLRVLDTKWFKFAQNFS